MRITAENLNRLENGAKILSAVLPFIPSNGITQAAAVLLKAGLSAADARKALEVAGFTAEQLAVLDAENERDVFDVIAEQGKPDPRTAE